MSMMHVLSICTILKKQQIPKRWLNAVREEIKAAKSENDLFLQTFSLTDW